MSSPSTLDQQQEEGSLLLEAFGAVPGDISPNLPVGCLEGKLRSDRKKVSCAAHELREYYLIVGLMENIM